MALVENSEKNLLKRQHYTVVHIARKQLEYVHVQTDVHEVFKISFQVTKPISSVKHILIVKAMPSSERNFCKGC